MTAAFEFLKFCRVLLNMVCGYPTGNGCVVCSDLLTSDCVIFAWVVSSIGFNFARTNLCCRDGLFLCATTEVLGKYGSEFCSGLISSVFKYLFESLCIITKVCDKDQFLFVVFRFFLE